MPIVETIQALTAAMSAVKELRSLEKQFDEAVFKLKIADLTTTLADAKLALTETQDEMRSKDEEIARLKDAFRYRDETVISRGQRFKAIDGKPMGKPLCPICELEGVFVEQVKLERPGRPGHCPRCKSDFERPTDFGYPEDWAAHEALIAKQKER